MARRRMQAVLQSIARPWPWLWELGWQNQWRSLAVERDEDDAGDCELRSKNFSRTCAPIKTSKTVRKSSSDAHSAALQYVWRILCLVRPWSVLYLSALSVAEALVVARVGQVAGSFYKIVVDKNSSALFEMLLQSSLLYALCIGLAALADWLEALLALAWRAELSERLHSSYCHAAAFAHLGRHWAVGGETAELEKSLGSQSLLIQGSTLAVTMPGLPLASSSALPVLLTVPAPPLDNPDQRMTSDVRLLTESLAVLARLAASTPVKAAYYSLLTRRLLGWVGLLAVYAGFVLGALAQAAAALAASRVVARREAAEGDLRAAHARLRALREAAGLAVAKGGGWEWSRGMEGEHVEPWPARDDRSPAGFAFASSEHAALSAALARLLREQRRVAGWRAALTLVSKAVDYGGALLNYSVVGAAVFAGAADAWDGGSGGATAEFVSNASFASMSLIYAFTELADKGEKMAAVAGVAVRVGGLLDAVRGWEHGAAEEGEVGEGEVAEEENGNVPEEVDASAPESTTLLQQTQPSSDPTILFEIDALTLRVNPSSGGPEIRAAPHSPTRLLPLRSPPLPSPARVLVQSLSLRLRRGRCVLVSGPNGCGKSSLLRALAGLEPTDPGSRISRPSRARLFFAAQTPLAAPLPSLPAQLAYPAPPPPRAELSPRERAVLNAVGLEGLAQAEPRISSGAWSPGELQRLAFARCLLRRPALDLALLDEPTSAVGVQAACQLFGLLRAAGVTYLSVGQDCEHLRRVHDSHLRFSGREGDWELKELPEA